MVALEDSDGNVAGTMAPGFEAGQGWSRQEGGGRQPQAPTGGRGRLQALVGQEDKCPTGQC